MANYPLVNADGNVQEVIIWDGVTTYAPPSGLTPILDQNSPPQVSIGWTYANGVFTDPKKGE